MSVDATLQPWEPLPFVEAADFWRAKVPLTAERVQSLSAAARERAFTVAGLAKQRMVESVFTGLQQAIEAGESFGEFKNRIREVIAEKGWTGQRDFRVQTIFRTNIQTAYNTGKWQQIQEAGDALEFLQYDAVGDSRTRPTHAALDGKVFRKDSPFWQEWYPPNGFNCRCTVRAMSKAEMEARGLKAEDAGDYLGKPVTVGPGRDQVLLPDPGFGSNSAQNFWEGLAAAATGRSGKPLLVPLPGLPGAKEESRPTLAQIQGRALPALDRSRLLPADSPRETIAAGVREVFGSQGVIDALGDRVLPRGDLVTHLMRKPRNHVVGLPLLGDVLREPYEVWLTPMTNGKQVVLRKHYIRFWAPDGDAESGMLVVAEVDGAVCQTVTAYLASASHLDRKRLGKLLFGSGTDTRTHRATTRRQGTSCVESPAPHPRQTQLYGVVP